MDYWSKKSKGATRSQQPDNKEKIQLLTKQEGKHYNENQMYPKTIRFPVTEEPFEKKHTYTTGSRDSFQTKKARQQARLAIFISRNGTQERFEIKTSLPHEGNANEKQGFQRNFDLKMTRRILKKKRKS